MKKLDHVWAVACINIDVLDVAPATLDKYEKTVGFMAQMIKDAGADAVMAGTPVCYALGYNGVKRIKRCVGNDIKVIADLKAQDGVFSFFPMCASFGADYCSVSVVNNPGGFHGAMIAQKDHGVKAIADLYAVPEKEIVSIAAECSQGGADIVFLDLGHDDKLYDIYPGRKESNYTKEIAEAISCPLFVAANTLDEIEQAIKNGADGIVFGDAVKDASHRTYLAMEKLTRQIRQLDKKYHG